MDKRFVSIKVNVDRLDDIYYFDSVVKTLRHLRDVVMETALYGSDIKVSYDDSHNAGLKTDISSIVDKYSATIDKCSAIIDKCFPDDCSTKHQPSQCDFTQNALEEFDRRSGEILEEFDRRTQRRTQEILEEFDRRTQGILEEIDRRSGEILV